MSTQTGGNIVWNLDVDDSKFTSGINKAKGATDDLAKNAEGNFSGIKNVIVGAFESATTASFAFAGGLAAVGTALVAASSFGIKYAADLETMRAGFITLLGSAKAADTAIAQIQKDAATTPFEFKGLVNANQLLTSVTKNSGESERLLLNVGKALTAMGKGQPELDRIIVNLQQIGAIGHANAIDIKQFAYAGIPIYDLLNEKLKTTKLAMTDNSKAIGDNNAKLTDLQGKLKVAQLQQSEFTDKTKASTRLLKENQIGNYTSQIAELTGKTGKLTASNGKLAQSQSSLDDAISSGQITFKLLEDTFNSAGEGSGRFAKAFQEQGGTFNQVLSNLKDNLGITASKIVIATGIFDRAKKALVGLTNITQFMASDAGLKIINDLFDQLKQNIPVVVGFIIGGLVPAFSALLPYIIGLASSFVSLIPFLAIGAAVGFVIQEVVKAMGGWDKVKDLVVGAIQTIIANFKVFTDKFTALIPVVQGYLDKLSGQFKAFGERTYDAFNLDASNVSFGNFFSQLFAKVKPAIDEIGRQIGQGFTNALQQNFGKTGNIGDLFGRLMSTFQTVSDIILRTLTPAFDTFSKTLVAIKPQLDQLLQQLGPLLINGLQVVAGAIAGIIIIITGIFSGLVQAVSFALPFIIQAFTGFAQIINGILAVIVGIFTLNFGQIWDGIKSIFEGIFNVIVGVLGAIIGAIAGFVKGVIDFFVQLYNVLVGHSIVPDMINAIVALFFGMPKRIYDGIISMLTLVPKVFNDTWAVVTAIVANWATDVYNWGVNIAKSFADGFSKLGDWLKEKITSALNSAKNFLKGNSPPIAGPFKDIDLWGENVGKAWAEGLQKSIGNLTLQNPMTAGAPAFAPSVSIPSGGAGRTGPMINIEEMNVRDDSDITDIGRELGFRIETSSGYTENG